MKARTAALFSMVMVILLASTAWALDQVPPRLNVQGVLRNTAGEVVTGYYDIKVNLYDAQTGGTLLYGEEQDNYHVVGGVFDIYLGPMSNIFKNRTDVWLGITVKAHSESTWDSELPRVRISSVGYAFQAEHAEQADELLGPATDLNCTNCVGQGEVDFNWALGVSPGGDAAGLTCTGCVGTTDLGDKAVVQAKIGDGAVGTAQLANGAVTNAKIGADAVTTDKIKDHTITSADLANGAVGSAQIANGAVGDDQLGVNYASSDTKGGPANGLECSGCVSGGASGDIASATITSVNLANGAVGTDQLANDAVTSAKIADGTITNIDIATATITGDRLVAGTITNRELGVNYAGSTSKGGPASDLACVGGPCVSESEVDFNYAGSSSKGGAATSALDLSCTNCVASGEVDFNYAGSSSKGGPANDLSCTGCVGTTEIGNNQVTPAKLASCSSAGQILKWNGSSWACAADATSSYSSGWGITISGSTISANQTTLDGRYLVKNDNWTLPKGKHLIFGNGDGTAFFYEYGDDNDDHVDVRMDLGGTSSSANEQFSIYDEHSSAIVHSFKANGNTYHKGNLSIDGYYYGNGSHLSHVNADTLDGLDSTAFVRTNCSGCVSTTMLANKAVTNAKLGDGAVSTVKIANGAVTKEKLGASGCSNGQILKFNGSSWQCSADQGGSYTAGWGISISGQTISAKQSDLDARYVLENEANSIKSGMIKDGEVGHADMAADAIYSGNIKDGQVTSADIANGTIKDADVSGSANIAGSKIQKASGSNYGVVEVGSNIHVSNGVISVPYASSSTAGVIKVGSGLGISNGVLSTSMGGSGSTNRVPLWTSSTHLGNSNIYQNNGKIGIGTSSPQGNLEVAGGDITPAAGYGLRWRDNPWGGGGDTAWIKYYQDGSGEDTALQIGIGNDGVDDIQFYQQGAIRMIVKNGHVGVGTTNPGYTLDDAGSFRAGSSIDVHNSNTRLTQGTNNALRVTTNYGYVEIGPQNGTWAHFVTDRGQFYFNKSVSIDGTLSSYGNGSHDLGSNGDRWRNLYVNQICLHGSCRTSWPGGVGGGGTSGYLPKWSGSSSLGDSHVSESGSTVYIHGELAYGDSWTRTQTRCDASPKGGKSGFYQCSSASHNNHWPSGASGWWHLLDVRHSNTGNNYAMQFAGSFNDQELYFRKTNNNPNQAWRRVVFWDSLGSAMGNSYIKNTTSQQSANFNISGTGKGGILETSNGAAGMGYSNELWADWINYRNRTGGLRIGNGNGNGGYGAEYAAIWYDGNNTCWQSDPSGYTRVKEGGAYNLYVRNGLHSQHGVFNDGLFVNGAGGLGINPGGSWRGALTVYNYGVVIPSGNNQGAVGISWGGSNGKTRAWRYMYSYHYYAPSDMKLKKDVVAMDDQDLDWALNSIRKAELAFWWYKEEYRDKKEAEIKDGKTRYYRPMPHIGAIAQSLPDVVKTGGEGIDKQWINLPDMIGLNMTAIRAVDRNNRRLKAKVRQLQGKVDYLTKILVSRGLITQDQLEEMDNLPDTPSVNQ